MGIDQTGLFEVLYSRYYPNIHRYFSACFDRDIADDLSQQTFLNLWRYLNSPGFFMRHNWNAWLFRTAVNLKNDWLRKKQRTREQVSWQENGLEEIPVEEEPLEQLGITQAFSLLQPDDREILLLKSSGLTSSQIGRLLGISTSAVRSRLAVSREKLKGALEENGIQLD